METKPLKLDIGCGRNVRHDHVGIDITQITGSNGKPSVDVVMDICKQKLPYEDSSVQEIACFNTLEHLDDFKFALNEMHRVLKDGGILHGDVPICGTRSHWKDPTHKRCFVKETFAYFTGTSEWNPDKPSHPRYADYGFLPWHLVELTEKGDMLFFKLSPRKV